MGRGIDRQALVSALLETSTELGIRRRELLDERKAHEATRTRLAEAGEALARADAANGTLACSHDAAMALNEALMRAMEERSLAIAERDAACHAFGCVVLALRGERPADDWPDEAREVARLVGSKVAVEPAWGDDGLLRRDPDGATVGVAYPSGEWCAWRGGWRRMADGRGRADTLDLARMAVVAWLDARGVRYETRPVKR